MKSAMATTGNMARLGGLAGLVLMSAHDLWRGDKLVRVQAPNAATAVAR